MKPPEPEIVRREGFLVLGTVTRRYPRTDPPEAFVAIWRDFETHHEDIRQHSVDAKYYGVSFAPDADGRFDYLAGMAVRPVEEAPPKLELREVPAATYAVFACPVSSIGSTYGYIFGEWRARSGHRTDDTKPVFEEYPPATETNAPVRLHIPIRGGQGPAGEGRRRP